MNNMLVFLHNGKLTLEDFEHIAINEDMPSDPPCRCAAQPKSRPRLMRQLIHCRREGKTARRISYRFDASSLNSSPTTAAVFAIIQPTRPPRLSAVRRDAHFSAVFLISMKVHYAKPYLTIDKQVDLLDSRGLRIKDRSVARDLLTGVNYYRLTGYAIPFSIDREHDNSRVRHGLRRDGHDHRLRRRTHQGGLMGPGIGDRLISDGVRGGLWCVIRRFGGWRRLRRG